MAKVVEGLAEVASGGRVSWLPFLRFMCGLADIQPLRRDSCPAVAMARKTFNVFDQEKQQEVDLRVLASGLSVSVGLQITRQRAGAVVLWCPCSNTAVMVGSTDA